MSDAGIPEETLQYVDNTDRALVEPMLKMREYIDLLVPRGGSELIKFVAERGRHAGSDRGHRCLPHLRG